MPPKGPHSSAQPTQLFMKLAVLSPQQQQAPNCAVTETVPKISNIKLTIGNPSFIISPPCFLFKNPVGFIKFLKKTNL
jgi:hypothetical protein